MLSGLGGSGFLSRSGFLRGNFSLRALRARATQGTHRILRFSSHYMYHNILHHDFLDVSVGVSVCTCTPVSSGQISFSGQFLNGIFLFGHGAQRRRYRISYAGRTKIRYRISKHNVFLMPALNCIVVLLPHHVPLPCQSYARDEQKGCTYLCMKWRLDKSKEVARRSIYEAARAAVFNCVLPAHGQSGIMMLGVGWEEHIPVKRHCCCDGRCGLAAAGDVR